MAGFVLFGKSAGKAKAPAKTKESPALKAWEKTPAGKADDKADKKAGIKEGPRDTKLDMAKMMAGKKAAPAKKGFVPFGKK